MHAEGSGHVEIGSGSKSGTPTSMSDNWLQKIEDYITGGISRFVAFLFLLITIGAVLGYFVAQRRESEILLVIPAAAGLLAYYSRDFAVAVLAIVVVFIIL